MTRDDIIRMAREVGMGWWLDDGKLERFAALVAAHERERLAQPEQEPVAWTPQVWWQFRPDGTLEFQKIKRTPNGAWEDYTTPPRREWVGLTKEEAKEISLANRPYVVDMVAALEARLKEKNSAN